MENKQIAGLDVVEVRGDPGGAVIILLHGFGASAMDLVSLANLFQQSPRPTWLFPNGPLEISFAPGYSGRAWFPIDFGNLSNPFPDELNEPREHIERLIGELAVPRSKLILGGYSQGAILAVETALHGMDPVAALVILSGTLTCEPNWRRLSHLHAKTSFFQSHGINDPLLSLQNAEDLSSLLQEGGLKGEFHRFNGGHEIPQAILDQLTAFLKGVLS